MCRSRVVSSVSHIDDTSRNTDFITNRCTTRDNDLDNLDGQDRATRRSHEHTSALLEAFSLKELWDGYGIVGDVVVHVFAI